jgi:FkbM family methyltransferase
MKAASTAQSYSQDTEYELTLLLARHTRKTFVDVGAEKGGFARMLIEKGFVGSIFEPFPDHLPSLHALVQGTKCTVYDYAVDSSDHPALFHIACDESGSPLDYYHSLNQIPEHRLFKHSKTMKVACRSLASLAAEGKIDSHIGVLKIDTEGNDLKVLQGLGPLRPEVIICEFFTPSLYKEWEFSFPEKLVAAARSLGYSNLIAVKRYHGYESISVNAPAFIDGQWGNLFFIQDGLWAKSLPEITHLAQQNEKAFYDKIMAAEQLAVEKEKVIQSLTGQIKNARAKVTA